MHRHDGPTMHWHGEQNCSISDGELHWGRPTESDLSSFRSGLIQACYSRRPGIWDDGQDDVSSKQTPRAKVIKLASTSSTSQA